MTIGIMLLAIIIVEVLILSGILCLINSLIEERKEMEYVEYKRNLRKLIETREREGYASPEDTRYQYIQGLKSKLKNLPPKLT